MQVSLQTINQTSIVWSVLVTGCHGWKCTWIYFNGSNHFCRCSKWYSKLNDDKLLSCQICLKQQDIAIVAMKHNITETAFSCPLHDIFASLLVVKLVSMNLFLVTKRLITSTMSAAWVQYPAILAVYNIGEMIAIESWTYAECIYKGHLKL